MNTKKDMQQEKEDHKKHPLTTPDPETLHTTDPQEHMKGPVSSVVQNITEEPKKEDTPDEKKKKDKNQD